MSDPSEGFSRPLGAAERNVWLIDRVARLNFAIVAHLAEAADATQLTESFERARRSHWLLSARIDPAAGGSFVPSRNEMARIAFSTTNDPDAWKSSILEELDQPLSWKEGPLLRAFVLLGPDFADVVLIFHHAIADARAGVAFMLQWLSDSPKVKHPLRGSVEELLPREAQGIAGYRLGTKLLLRQLTSRLSRPSSRPEALDGPIDPRSRRAGFVHYELGQTESRKFFEECRRHEVGVHSMLASLLLHSARRRLGGSGPRRLNCFSPVDTGPYLVPRISGAMGLFVSAVLSDVLVDSKDSVWKTAAGFERVFRRSLQASEPLALLALQNFIPTRRATPNSAYRRAVATSTFTTNLTNLGRIEVPRALSDRLRSIHFVPAGSALSEASLGCAAVTVEDRMLLNFLHVTPDVPQALALTLSQEIVGELRCVANV